MGENRNGGGKRRCRLDINAGAILALPTIRLVQPLLLPATTKQTIVFNGTTHKLHKAMNTYLLALL